MWKRLDPTEKVVLIALLIVVSLAFIQFLCYLQ